MVKINFLKKISTGRSMIEMLGVLAVIGVLSLGALAGFQYAMNRHRGNETIYDVMLRAANVPMIDEQYTSRTGTYTWRFAGLPEDGEKGSYYRMKTTVSDLSDYVYRVIVYDVPKKVCRQILALNPSEVDAIYVEGEKGTTEECPNDLNEMGFYFDEQRHNNPSRPSNPCVGNDCSDSGCTGSDCTICVGNDCDSNGNCIGADCTSCKGQDCGQDGVCTGSNCTGCQGEGCTPNPTVNPETDPCAADSNSAECIEKCKNSPNPTCCQNLNASGCNCSSRPTCDICEEYTFDEKGCAVGCKEKCDALACERCEEGVCVSTCSDTERCDNGACVAKCSGNTPITCGSGGNNWCCGAAQSCGDTNGSCVCSSGTACGTTCCGTAEVCNESTNTCEPASACSSNEHECTNGSDTWCCANGQMCSSVGNCSSCSASDTCDITSDTCDLCAQCGLDWVDTGFNGEIVIYTCGGQKSCSAGYTWKRERTYYNSDGTTAYYTTMCVSDSYKKCCHYPTDADGNSLGYLGAYYYQASCDPDFVEC